MTGCAVRCSTTHWTSSPPPGPASRCIITGRTTPWTASSSSPARCTGPGCRCALPGSPGNVKPLHRAARYQGFFPVNLGHPDQLAEAAAIIAALDPASPYDIAVGLPPGTDPAPYAEVGATWWLPEFDPATVSLDQVRQMTRDLLAPLDAARTKRALGQLRGALAAHQSGSGVFFDSRAWLITARR